MGRSTKVSFPKKLRAMLDDAATKDHEDIICWQPGGKSFKVINPERFSKEIMPLYFKQSQYKSFQRQLNLYGFRRVPHGPNKGGYVHKSFRRNAPELCDAIERLNSISRVPPMLVLNKSSSDDLKDEGVMKQHTGMTDNNEAVLLTLEDQFLPTPIHGNGKDLLDANAIAAISADDDSEIGSAMEEISLLLSSIDTVMDDDNPNFDPFPLEVNHDSDADDTVSIDGDELQEALNVSDSFDEYWNKSLSNIKEGDDVADVTASSSSDGPQQQIPSPESCSKDEDESDEFDKKLQSFPYKLHLMLEQAKKEQYDHIVSWVHDGKAFKVYDAKAFVAKVMPLYFDQTKYESFRRQLNLYGFSRQSRGADRGVTSHPYFMQSDVSFCQHIKRPVNLLR